MSDFPKATTKEAVDHITSSVRNILPIEEKIEDYSNLLSAIFSPGSPNYNDEIGNLWKGVIWPTIGDHGRTYGGETPQQYVPKIKQNFLNMEKGTEEEKQIAKKILDALMVLPNVVKNAEVLIPQLRQAESEAETHKKKAWIPNTQNRRQERYIQLSRLRFRLERIVDYSENGKNKMIIEAITSDEKKREQKREQMLAFRAMEKGTRDPTTGENIQNPLNHDTIMNILSYLGGKGYSKCKKMKDKKYITRKSPAYSASKCAKGTKKKGNDGKMYIVKSAKNGVKRWVKYTKKKKSKSKKKNKH